MARETIATLNTKITDLEAKMIQMAEICDKNTQEMADKLNLYGTQIAGLLVIVKELSENRAPATGTSYVRYESPDPVVIDDSNKIAVAFKYVHAQIGSHIVVWGSDLKDKPKPPLSKLQVYVECGTDKRMRVTVRSAMLRVPGLKELTVANLPKKTTPQTATREQWFVALSNAIRSDKGQTLIKKGGKK